MKENRIVKDALILFGIALVLSALLGLVNQLTKDKIAEQELKAKKEAYEAVFEDVSFEEDDELTALLENMQKTIAELYSGVEINEVVVAKNADGGVEGYALNITSSGGYGGEITLALGVTTEGTITGMSVISHSETAGLGANCTKASFADQFVGIQSEQIEYTKSGKTESNQIDAISSATFTTKAVTGAVNAGLYLVYQEIGLEG